MSDLSPTTRELLDAARTAGSPTPEDRARVFAGVASKLGLAASAAMVVSAPAKATAAPVAIAGSKLGAVIVLALSLGAVVTAGALALAPSRSTARAVLRPASLRARTLALPPPAMPSPPVATVPVLSSHDLATPETAHIAAPPSRVASTTRAHAASTRAVASTTADTLGDELALIRTARAAVRAHNGATALALLDQHAVSFPHGMLREERDATRVLALCETGQVAAARLAAQRFLESHSQSPHAARIHASCAGESP